MTIDEMGKRVQKKDPGTAALTPVDAGRQYLAQHPTMWEHVDDGIVAEHLTRLKDARYKNVSGVWSFFSNLGEEQRTKYFKQRVETARALVELERHARSIGDINLQHQLNVSTVALSIATAKAAIHKLGVEAGLVEHAATKGRRVDVDQAIVQAEAVAGLTRMDKDADHRNVLALRTTESELKRKETQQLHEYEVEIQRLRADLGIKEHEAKALLDHKLKQKEIQKEVDGTIALASTDMLVRRQKVELLSDYVSKLVVLKNNDKLDRAERAMKVEIMENEIALLKKDLYGESGTMAGAANVRQEPQGGAPPSQSGSQLAPPQGEDDEPASGPDARHVN